MSLAIRFGDTTKPEEISGFIYFDAVTKFSRQRRGDVTNHPLDAGASISDHYTSDNPKYSIVGIISSADISGIPFNINVDNQSPLNVNPQPSAVQVSDIGSGLLNFIPDSLTQFLKVSVDSITVDQSQRTNYNVQVEKLITKLMTGLVYNEKEKKLKNRMTLVTLYGFENGILSTEASDLVMTSFDVEEDADSGTGLFVTITLEEVRFVTLQKANLPKDVSAKLNKAAQGTAKKGKADSNKSPVDTSSTEGPKKISIADQIRIREKKIADLQAKGPN